MFAESLILQDEPTAADKPYKQEPTQVTYSTSAVSSTQEVLYINGNGTYSYHSYRGLGGGLLNLSDASTSGEYFYRTLHVYLQYKLLLYRAVCTMESSAFSKKCRIKMSLVFSIFGLKLSTYVLI